MNSYRDLLPACAAALSLAIPARADGPTLTALDLGPNGYFTPRGISADGRVVGGGSYIVGQGNQARRWREGVGFDYPGPSIGATASWCSAVSADGTVLVGGSGHAQFGDLEGWVRYGPSVGHVGSAPGHDTSDCLGVSADGTVAVGYGGVQSNPNLFEAGAYTEQGGWTNLGSLPGGAGSQAFAANADGSVIVGWSTGSNPYTFQAFRWTAATGMVSLGNLLTGTECTAYGVNADGSVVVGADYVVQPNFSSIETAWRWTSGGGMASLGSLQTGGTSQALAVSPDGAIVVGAAEWNGGYTAFVWDAAHGMRRLADVLAAQGMGAQLAGWDLTIATCIAGSGPWYLAGEGDWNGLYEGWVVKLTTLEDAAGTPFCAGDGSLATPCPCGNTGGSGRGCASSQVGSAGALLLAWGGTQPDHLALDASGMLPSALCIFLQGDAQNGNGIVFGDGVRCVAGHLRRLGVKTAVNGAAVYPQAGDLSVSARSARAGDPLAVGAQRWYQTYFRDPSPAFCPNPPGNTWNVSSGVAIVW